MKDRREIRPKAILVFQIFPASGHVGPAPRQAAERRRYTRKCVFTSRDVRRQRRERIRQDIAVVVQDHSDTGSGVCQFIPNARMVAVPITAHHRDNTAGRQVTLAFSHKARETDVGRSAYSDDQVIAGAHQSRSQDRGLDDLNVLLIPQLPSSPENGASAAVGPGYAGARIKLRKITDASALSATDIQNLPGRRHDVLHKCARHKMVHHRGMRFGAKLLGVDEALVDWKVPRIEEKVPARGRQQVQRLVRNYVKCRVEP